MIREMTAEEVPLAARIIRRAFATVAEEFGLTRENYPTHPSFLTEERLLGEIARGLHLFILEEDGSPACMVGLRRLEDGTTALERLAVLPEHRHRGCGVRLVEFVCRQEVLYWTEGADTDGYDLETIQSIYRSTDPLSKFSFIIEYEQQPIGECWLQRMNLPYLLQQFPDRDCRRIDLMIGEKDYWNRGIGTTVISLLTRFGFEEENADAIFGVIFDFNHRSRRAFEKNGFQLFEIVPTPGEPKSKADYVLMHTREQNVERKAHADNQ